MAHYVLERTTSELTTRDKLKAIKVRLGVGRNHYMVAPGLYKLGSPGPASPVLVTANYKLTFDHLRSQLPGLAAWILVLNTRGINVWCAAGKGTFGTGELLRAIKRTNLAEVVEHRNLILPQLGAPGIQGHRVTKVSGFKVYFGPVRASDLPRYLAEGCKATEDMRRVTFTLGERLLVVPVEMQYGVKLLPVLFLLLLLYNALPMGAGTLGTTGGYRGLMTTALYQWIPYVGAFLAGTFGVAALLPWLPGRSFALKGAVLGMMWTILMLQVGPAFLYPDHTMVLLGHSLIMAAIIAFFALNYTGSTTYTSLSGVQKETVFSIPVMGLATLVGIILLVVVKVQGG